MDKLERGQFKLEMSDICASCPKKDLVVRNYAAQNNPTYMVTISCANYELCTAIKNNMEEKK